MPLHFQGLLISPNLEEMCLLAPNPMPMFFQGSAIPIGIRGDPNPNRRSIRLFVLDIIYATVITLLETISSFLPNQNFTIFITFSRSYSIPEQLLRDFLSRYLIFLENIGVFEVAKPHDVVQGLGNLWNSKMLISPLNPTPNPLLQKLKVLANHMSQVPQVP
ncbi:hypothetical protein GBA52_007065 [Prunus armeniaca]|nr:hypothetical protein GBA52_007065 [Prunus armeniaca]